MGLFRKKEINKDDTDPPVAQLSNAELAQEISSLRELKRFHLLSIKTFLFFIKEFALDYKEIESDRFKEKTAGLADLYASSTAIDKVRKSFEAYKDLFISFAKRTKDYLLEREKELTDIIDILTQGITVIHEENRKFNVRLLEQNVQFEQLTELDDIRKIKEELKKRVNEVQRYIQEKQTVDASRMANLNRKVETLQVNLKRAEDASLKDGLTGAFNRLAFDRAVKDYVERNTATGMVLSILMIDIDNFKKINDTYGHQVGDRVLLAMVKLCAAHVRKDDMLARYGGEEFSLLLPGLNLKGSIKKADEIRKVIEEARYRIDSSDANSYINFTVSIGVSTIRSGDTEASFVERADKALYLAKRQGKNRVYSEKDIYL